MKPDKRFRGGMPGPGAAQASFRPIVIVVVALLVVGLLAAPHPAYLIRLALANAGVASAQLSLGDVYLAGSRDADHLGEIRAQSLFGWIIGRDVPPDPERAMAWYARAAAQGGAEAEFRYGIMNLRGVGGRHNRIAGVKLIRQAAEQGYGRAEFELGRMYADGDDYVYGALVPQDDAEAARWFRLAAAQNVGAAMIAIGDLYFEGRGVKQDDAEAARWYQKAEPNWLNPTRLGILYEEGRGVPRDIERALDLYRRGASWHYPDAAFRLGELYEAGKGVAQNLDQARRWYDIAAKRGYEPARQALDRLAALRERPGDSR
ncbi:MAG: tetratricopeptide repeat protein [Candidatus Eiseniibacteriota bacterium]